MAEALTVNLAAELLSGFNNDYFDYHDVFFTARGEENIVYVTLKDATDPSVPKRLFRFIGEELNG